VQYIKVEFKVYHMHMERNDRVCFCIIIAHTYI